MPANASLPPLGTGFFRAVLNASEQLSITQLLGSGQITTTVWEPFNYWESWTWADSGALVLTPTAPGEYLVTVENALALTSTTRSWANETTNGCAQCPSHQMKRMV